MEAIVLKATQRDTEKKASELRKEKLVPCVFYAHGKDNLHLAIEYEPMRKAYLKAGSNTLIDLEVEGKIVKVLIHDIQFDPIMDDITHVDFYGVKMKEKIDTEIPLEFVGLSSAVKNLGGILETTLHEVEVRCLPTDLVPNIEVDIAVLENLGDAIHLSDLNLPKGMELLQDEALTVISVQAPKEEAVEEVSEEDAVAQVETSAQSSEKEE